MKNTLMKNLKNIPINQLSVVSELFNEINEYNRIKEESKTRRTEIKAQRDVLLANIQAKRDAVLYVLEHTFKERSETLRNSYNLLNDAINKGNSEMAENLIGNIYGLVKSSPLGSLEQIREALSNESTPLQLD